jgi:hypothetical protein
VVYVVYIKTIRSLGDQAVHLNDAAIYAGYSVDGATTFVSPPPMRRY